MAETRSGKGSSTASRQRPASAPVGRYEIEEKLARGGMGVVYRAHDHLLERPVALKRLSASRDEMLRARLTALFRNEYETLAQLAHPRIVQVYEYGVDAEGPFYVMELLSGGDLSCAAPLPFAEAARVLRDVASALALVHARRMIHRDLSPANVRLTSDGRAKLIDFGALTSFGVPQELVGTPALVAPECLGGAALDQRADLYALGALAYWCVTGRHAVRAASIAELPQALELPLVMPSEYAADLPRGMEELILSLLNHDPLARPASAAEVMDRLSALAGLPAEDEQERVALSYLAHPPLVGRTPQLETFGRALSDTCAGHGGTLWIEAPHGMGRTALLDVYARKAQLDGATLLRAAAHSQAAAFGVLRALVRNALAFQPSLGPAHPELQELLVGGEHGGQGSAGLDRSGTLLASVESCLLEFARRTPLVLLVDDVQLADPESLGVLAALSGRASQHALLLVLSAATGEGLADAHAHARLLEHARQLALTPLDLELVVELTTAVFGPVPNVRRLSLWLWEHGAENPLRCLKLARLLLQRQEIQYLSGTFSLPYDVTTDLREQALEEATRSRIAQLGPAAQHTARLLAAYETPVTLGELCDASGQPQREIALALTNLGELGLVRSVDERYSFAHDSVRTALVQGTAPEVMCGLHLGIGRMMLMRPDASLDTRCRAAYHLLRGGADDEGTALLTRAASPLARAHESLAKAVPALELALSVSNARKAPDARNTALLIPLCLAGYYRDPRLHQHYFRRTLAACLEVTGVKLAGKLKRLLGAKLSLALGLLIARVRSPFSVAQASHRSSFRELLTGLFAVAGTGISAACASFDFQLAYEIGEALAPFAILGPRHPANIVREFCVVVAEGRRASQHKAEEGLLRLAQLLEKPGQIPKLDEEVRVQVLVGVVYALGMIQLLRSSDTGLAWAAAMDREQRGFFAPHAELLRMLHHAMRGDQQAAEPHRERTERLALLGGSGWSAVNNTAHRAMLVYQWTEDSIGLLRVITDLKRFAEVNSAVTPHIGLAEAYLELLRGRPEEAVARYERLFSEDCVRHSWTWIGERGRYAEALNALGRHAEARAVCEALLAELSPGERAYKFLTHVPLQQLALAEAYLGEHAAASVRLDALLAETESTGNPLLSGTLHRYRAEVALIAGDRAGFENHLRGMVRYFRSTGHPCLIRMCERLYARGLSTGAIHSELAHSGDLLALASVAGSAARSGVRPADNDVPDQTELVTALDEAAR